jgi:hypothetical protein
MMIDTIQYTITITNVTNPATVQPLTYSVSTMFNQVVSQIYTTTYSIANPLPLSLSYARSNNTYAQPAVLTLSFSAGYPSFDEIKLSVPALVMTVSSGSNYLASTNNSLFEVSQIYSLMGNNSLSVNIVNPSSTAVSGQIQVSMFVGGYLTAQGVVAIAAVGPVYLGVVATSGNRVVGGSTDLTITMNRVNPFSV